MERSDVAAWVRDARRSKGWTQQRLADELGLTKANVSHWETCKHDPSFLQLLKIKELTGYPLRQVETPSNWPLPGVPIERLTSLTEAQRHQIALGVIAMLAAM